eukprot:CAMPEP_0119495946 /NCGR_PEP_ID=MMETSP1344-20130328/19434_1 /TAXON_ID=236787 /ORGANISM="Florenciella parvula, Strain CCMP2471" /LENGTH=68 /DNA_ID=CAMNT_0007531585 /DNA_START=300 /DNA_END=503 /DNA_ORIENTATION=+
MPQPYHSCEAAAMASVLFVVVTLLGAMIVGLHWVFNPSTHGWEVASVNFCEKDYQFDPYVAEPANAVS